VRAPGGRADRPLAAPGPGARAPAVAAPAAFVLVAGALAAAAACARPGAELGPALALAGAGASEPTVAVDGRTGAVYVAWIARGGDAYVARVERGVAGAPVRVNDRPGEATAHAQAPAQVAVGPDGTVYVAWQKAIPVPGREFPASELRLARSTDGGRSFEPAVTVNDDAGGPPSSHSFHDIAVAADGTVYVSWIDSRERDRARAAGAAHPGTLPPPDVRVARSADGGRTFGPGVIVARGVCPCCRTALAVVGRTVYVAWRHVFPGEVRDIVVARSDDAGESFSAPVRVHADGWAIAGCPHAGPALAADPAGGLHVAWYTGRPDAAGLYAAWSADGGRSFGPPAPLVTGEWVAISRVRLAPAGPGTAWAAWEDRGGEARVVRIARLERGRPASAVLAGAGTAPGLAAAGGIWAVAWGTQEGGVRVRLGGATGPSGAGSP